MTVTPMIPASPGRSASAGGGHAASPRRVLAIALVLTGFVVYLAMNHAALSNLWRGFQGRGLRRTIAMGAYLAAGYVVLLQVLLAVRRRIALTALCAILGVSVLTNLIWAAIYDGAILTGESVDWLYAEAGQASNAWGEFRADMLAALGWTGLLMAALALLSRRIPASFPATRALGRGPIALIAGVAFVAFHALPLVRPVPFAMAEANLYAFAVPTLLATAPSPRPPDVLPVREPLVEKIVLVVDESVTHEVFQRVLAPALAGLPALDYGEATSFANCSSQSNALLRWGVERQSLPRGGYDPRATPHLWGYARAAHIRTTVLDGQSSGAPQNFLGPRERAQLDELVPALDPTTIERRAATDRRIAATLNERLRRPGRELIYVVKRGAHFPFERACLPGVVSVDAPKPVQHAEAVRCSTERFFEVVTQGVDLSSVLLIYTSDHGQDFESARSTHCSPVAGPSELSVPLVVVTGSDPIRHLLEPRFLAMQGRAAHAEIFPTLLYAMGYERSWLEAVHGPTLAGPPIAPLTLATRLPFPHWREPVVRFSSRAAGSPGVSSAGLQANVSR